MANFLEQFRVEVSRREPQPERLAMLIAGMAYPALIIEDELAQLDRVATVVERALIGVPPGYERAARLIDVLHYDLGFTGNREQYYDPDNSYFNIVLRRRVGLPIMLSLLCIAIGRRLGLAITGLAFPNHFMVRYADQAGVWLLDPFHNQVMALEAAGTYLSNLFERAIPLSEAMFEPVTPQTLTRRILLNLRNVYLGQRNLGMVLQVLDYLVILAPNEPSFWHEKGLLHYQMDHWEAASYHLRRYFFLTGQYLLAYGHETNDDLAQATLPPQARHLLNIFHEIEETRRRVN